MSTNITQNTYYGLATAVVSWVEPYAIDNSGPTTLTFSHSPGSTFSIGVTPVEYTAVDDSGNKVTSMFVIDIKGLYTHIHT